LSVEVQPGPAGGEMLSIPVGEFGRNVDRSDTPRAAPFKDGLSARWPHVLVTASVDSWGTVPPICGIVGGAQVTLGRPRR